MHGTTGRIRDACVTFVVFVGLQYWQHYWPGWPGALLASVHVALSAIGAIVSARILGSSRLGWFVKAVALTVLWALLPGLSTALVLQDGHWWSIHVGSWLYMAFIPSMLLAVSRSPAAHGARARVPVGSADANCVLAQIFANGRDCPSLGKLLAAAVAYALLAVVLTYPGVRHFHDRFIAFEGDSRQNIWNYWWFSKAVFGLRVNPYFTDYVFYPTGTSLLMHTLQPFHGLISAPMRLLLGPVAAYNALVFFSLVATGMAMYLLALAVCGEAGPAFVAGAMFTFCPFHMFKCFGHLNFAAAEWLPLYVLAFLKLHTSGRVRWALCAAGALMLNWACSWYLTMYCLILSGVFWLYLVLASGSPALAVRAWRALRGWLIRQRGRLGGEARLVVLAVASAVLATRYPVASFRVLCVFAAAMCVLLIPRVLDAKRLRAVCLFVAAAGVLVGPPVALAITNADRFIRVRAYPPDAYGCDLLALWLPASVSTYAPSLRWLPRLFGEVWTDHSSYLGITATALVLLGLRRPGLRPRCRFWVGTGLVFCILALGPCLRVGGLPVANMPYRLLWRAVPPLRIAGVPGRMSYLTILCVAVIAAIVLANLRMTRLRKALACAAACGLLLLEFLCLPAPTISAAVPAFYRRMALDGEDYAVVDSAYCMNMYYQTVHGKKLVGGYVSRPEKAAVRLVQSNPIADELAGFPQRRSGRLRATDADVQALRGHNVRYIIDHGARYRDCLERELGLTVVHRDADMDVYDIRQRPKGAFPD